MLQLNKILITGRLGKDPEGRQLEGGSYVVNFRIANPESYKKDDEWQDDTTWIDIVCWNKLAEYVDREFNKGDEVLVEGKLKSEEYENKEGIKVKKHKIIANSIKRLSKKETPF